MQRKPTATMRHEDMCHDNNCIYCHPNRQPYREAEEIQKTLTSEYSTEGEKECTEDWKKNSPNYVCHLCHATTETPKRKIITSRKQFNTHKWFKKRINSWSDQDKENCKGATKNTDEDKHRTSVMICAPCMSGRWEVIKPNKWKTATIDMKVAARHTDRVWRQKINDEIDTYKNTVDTQIETAIKDKTKPGLKTERDRKRTQEFIRDKTNKRLKSLYKHNLADPDD
jgi:hypothetical protein